MAELQSLYTKFRNLLNEQLTDLLHRNIEDAKAAAEQAQKEIRQEAAANRARAAGGICEGGFSCISALSMLRATPGMKQCENRIRNARSYKTALDGMDGNQGTSLTDSISFVEEPKADQPKNPKQPGKDAGKELPPKRTLQAEEYINRLKSPDSVTLDQGDLDIFGEAELDSPANGVDDMTNREVLASTTAEERRAIRRNINKYLENQKKELSNASGSNQLLSQVILSIGKLMSGAGDLTSSYLLDKKGEFAYEKAMYQAAMDMTSKAINQTINLINDLNGSLKGFFQDMMNMAAATGIRPS